MKGRQSLVRVVVIGGLVLACQAAFLSSGILSATADQPVGLPEVRPGHTGSFSELMYQRRSVRTYADGQMSLKQAAWLLFAAQGITRRDRFRTVPSAGALYPLEIFLVAGQVQGLEPGVYRYRPAKHDLVQTADGDRRKEVARQSVGQMWIAEAQAVMVICAVFERVTGKYGQRGDRYVHIESGCAAQNVSLAGFDLGIGSTIVGAFNDQGLAEVVQAGKNEQPLVVMPLGLLP